VQKVSTDYNLHWLQTEYGAAKSGSIMASRWVDFEASKEDAPWLRYETVGDARVRAAHQALDGITRKVDDGFWNSHYPPNGWKCRCSVSQLAYGSETSLEGKELPEIPKAFRTNLAKKGFALPETGGYFDEADKGVIDRSVAKLQRQKVMQYAKNNLVGKVSIKKSGIPNEIGFSNNSIDKFLSQKHKFKFEKNQAIYKIVDLIKNGKLWSGSPLPELKNRPNVKQYHYISTKVKDVDSYIVIKEMNNGKTWFHCIIDHKPIKK
jgi:hypothetical protein